MADSYRFVGGHADSLASGRPIAPYEEIPGALVDPEDPHDEALIDDGVLIPIVVEAQDLAGDALEQRARDLNIPNRSKLSADELRKAVAKAEKEATK